MQRSVGGDTVFAVTPAASMAPSLGSGAPEALFDKLRPGPGRLTSEVTEHQSARIHRAMIKITADQGYDAVKVRDVVRLAGVSTRAFYQLFESKEDCFLRTHELIVRRAARGIIVSQAGEHGWQERLDLVCGALEHALMSAPNAVCLVAVDAYAAGPVALEQARRAQSTIEAMVGEAFARRPDGVGVPHLVVEGIVASFARILRTRFIYGRDGELPGLIAQLRDWVLSYPGKSVVDLPELDSRLAAAKLTSQAPPVSPALLDDDRAVILAAVAKLVADDGYNGLTIPRIRAKAGVSRRKFDAHFERVEDCFLAAVEERADEALGQAGRAQIGGRTWAGGICRAIATLADRVVDDPILTSVCRGNDFLPGSTGSRCRKRLIVAISDQLLDNVPVTERPSDLAMEASTGAVWELFHRYVIRGPLQQRPQISATLSYMTLAPLVGSSAAIAAIRQEQTA